MLKHKNKILIVYKDLNLYLKNHIFSLHWLPKTDKQDLDKLIIN